jgi:hypothetical protein
MKGMKNCGNEEIEVMKGMEKRISVQDSIIKSQNNRIAKLETRNNEK